jgi:CHAD domain-containing protein
MTVAEAFAAIVQSCLRHFRLNEELISVESNSGPLHQARVALRRLRSAFSLFRPAIADGEFVRLRDALREFADLLGRARNLDVMLAAPGRGRGKEGREAHRRLKREREDAYRAVAAGLSGSRLPCLILDIVAWAETGAWRAAALAQGPILPFAVDRLDRRWKRVRREAKAFDTLGPEQRHRLRIDIKKMRYACEFFVGLLPQSRRAERKSFVARLAELQDSLGKLNDIETARELAPELAGAGEDAGQEDAQALLRVTAHNLKALRATKPYWRG